MVAVYNDMLALGSSAEGTVVGVCRNSCPTLQYPLRKLSLTRILQVSWRIPSQYSLVFHRQGS